MKKIILVLVTLLFVLPSMAQEKVKPLTDMEVARRVATMDIEGQYYDDVYVTVKSTSPDYFLTDKYKVKIKIDDSSGKTIYKKTLKGVYLYVYSDG